MSVIAAPGQASQPTSRWTVAVTTLAAQVRQWLPPGVQAHEPGLDRPLNPALEVERNGVRLYLELAPASEESEQAVVEWWTSRGARARLIGPDPSGNWKVYTAEYVPMRYDWSAQDIADLVDALLAA